MSDTKNDKFTRSSTTPAGPNVSVENNSNLVHNIVTMPTPKTSVVDSYSPGSLKDTRGIRYSEVKNAFATETTRKNSRFAVSDLARGPLSIAEEEEARIQSEIQRRLDKKLEAIREEVKSEAYREGHAAGQEAAKAQVLEAAKPQLEQFQKLVSLFEGAKTELFKANEQLLLKIITQVAKSIVLRELKEDTDYTKRLVINLLERLGTRENIKIYVSTQVFSAVEGLKRDLAQSLGQLKNITIEADPEIEDMGCRVETEFGEVDADIAIQLKSIEEQLSG